ncbi:MAG: type II secretion system protein GspD [Betaproteobacteria bacterium]|nr:type II secretion system protein GspD [Betaproteobacteria bacterium]
MSPSACLQPCLRWHWITGCTAALLVLGLLSPVALAQKRGEPVTLNFSSAEIEAVARTMATIVGRQIVVDPRAKGQINLNTDKPVSAEVAYNQFLAALRLAGYAVVDAGDVLRVLPEADAKLQTGVVQTEAQGAKGNSEIITRIFQLSHENPNNLVPILRPLISPNNTINVNLRNNTLVITDYADNIERLGRIITALDTSSVTDVEVIALRHAIAVDMANTLLRLIEPAGAGGQAAATDAAFRTTVLAEPRSNSLLVRAANPARLALVRSLVEKLDRPSAQGAAGNIHVVYLKNADAVKLATTLRAAISAGGSIAASTPATPVITPAVAGQSPAPGLAGGTASGLSSAAAAPLSPSAQPSTGGQIQADPATNSLIITAPEPQYRQLREVIDRLDQRRAQVFVESLIAEVNADRAAEFGIQWQGALGNKGDNNIGLLGTNFTIAGQNLLSLATQAATGKALPSSGGNFGIAHQTGGVYVLGFLARAIEANGDGNILSTPNLLTLDNEEAKIVIGQNVPFVTGQYTNNAAIGGATVNPFQTIERRDVGLTLRVKPQISENGTVKMQIYQEVSSVQASSVNSSTGLITNKRSIESNVLVDDGAIVVLGGLLQDEFSGNVEKVPVVGDIPFFGNLFKGQTRSRKKTNLMVFLRPVVVRDARQSETLSLDRYDLMRLRQRDAQPRANPMLPPTGAPILPAPDLRPGVPATR